MASIYEKLLSVQSELKVPKSQQNTYGGYAYRSCEDILEELKPVLKKYDATVIVNDSIEVIADRVYVKATAKFIDIKSGDAIEASAYAREPLTQKGMADSQLTGAASSYARKYALNGLFLIDDAKDMDTNEFSKMTGAKNKKGDTPEEAEKNAQMTNDAMQKPLTKVEIETLKNLCTNVGLDIAKTFPNGIESLTGNDYITALEKLRKLEQEKKAKG